MEGEGVARICAQVKADGYEIATISHDNDASSMAQIRDTFPNAVECLDIGHAAKNICEKVKTLAKCADMKELRGFGERTKRWFQLVAHNANGDVTYYKENLQNGVAHWSGDHTKCNHGAIAPPHYKPLTLGGVAAKGLMDIFDPYIENASKYVGGACSNVCEAINNKITVYAPKRINFSSAYIGRASLALLVHNEDISIKLEVYHKIHVPVSPTTISIQQRQILQQEKDKERKRKNLTKETRLKNKENKKKRGKKITNAAHTYKGECLPDGDDGGDKDKNKEPTSKKPRTDPGHCGHESTCVDFRCVCKKFGRPCNSMCKCKLECCQNRNVNKVNM